MSLPLNWPGSLDSFPTVAPTQETDDPGFELDLVVNRIHALLMALETKLGTGSGAPASGQVLRSTAAGSATYGLLTDSNIAGAGTANINEGKIAASGTPQRVLATGASAPAAWQQVATPMLAANAVTNVQATGILSGSAATGSTNLLWSGSQLNYTNSGLSEVLFATFNASVYWTSGVGASSATFQIWEGSPGAGVGGLSATNWPGTAGAYQVAITHLLGAKTVNNPYFVSVTVSGGGTLNMLYGYFQLWTLKR